MAVMVFSLSDPCSNGGVCQDRVNGFVCVCLAGFRGERCAEDIDECVSAPCRNGGNCTDCVNSYTCSCPVGFSGITCEVNTPDCTERYAHDTHFNVLSLLAFESYLNLCCFSSPALVLTAEHVWTASTLSHACVCRDSPGITASMMLTSVTRVRVRTEAPVRMDTAHTNAPALTDTPDSTARYTLSKNTVNESRCIYEELFSKTL